MLHETEYVKYFSSLSVCFENINCTLKRARLAISRKSLIIIIVMTRFRDARKKTKIHVIVLGSLMLSG